MNHPRNLTATVQTDPNAPHIARVGPQPRGGTYLPAILPTSQVPTDRPTAVAIWQEEIFVLPLCQLWLAVKIQTKVIRIFTNGFHGRERPLSGHGSFGNPARWAARPAGRAGNLKTGHARGGQHSRHLLHMLRHETCKCEQWGIADRLLVCSEASSCNDVFDLFDWLLTDRV